MERKTKIYSSVIIVILILLFLILLIKISSTTEFSSYNQVLAYELNSINHYSGNLTLSYSGNFSSNQPFSAYNLDIPFSIPFNYTIYRAGKIELTQLNLYYQMDGAFALQAIENNQTFINSVRQYIDNGTKVIDNLSRADSLISKYKNISAPLSKIGFSNASGFYICSAYPKNYTLGIYSCGLVSNSSEVGLKYLIYNLSQVSAHAVGFDVNLLNLSVKFTGISSFKNESCDIYRLFSIIKNYTPVSGNIDSLAYINGTECISTEFGMPLYEFITLEMPLEKINSSLNLTLNYLSNSVPSNVGKFPNGYVLNLTYGSIS